MSRPIDSENLYKFLTDQRVKERGAYSKGVNKGLDIVVNPVFSENVSPKWWRYSGTFSLMASEYNKFLLVYLKHLLINWAEG